MGSVDEPPGTYSMQWPLLDRFQAQPRHWCQENKNTSESLEKQILETAGTLRLGEDILERMFSTEKS